MFTTAFLSVASGIDDFLTLYCGLLSRGRATRCVAGDRLRLRDERDCAGIVIAIIEGEIH
jgi:hypothetical protein